MDRGEYLKERQLLVALETESYKSFDKALLTFSSGAIVLSVTFLEKFNTKSLLCLLATSWVFWLLSILAQLSSYFISAKAMRRELEILNAQYRGGEIYSDVNKWTGWPTILNILALLSFFFGVVFFLAFVFANF